LSLAGCEALMMNCAGGRSARAGSEGLMSE
jgi:hypothetical protein